jgi:hypothetical protein
LRGGIIGIVQYFLKFHFTTLLPAGTQFISIGWRDGQRREGQHGMASLIRLGMLSECLLGIVTDWYVSIVMGTSIL